MKKTLILGLLAVLLLTGCGASDSAPAQTEPPAPKETVRVIPMETLPVTVPETAAPTETEAPVLPETHPEPSVLAPEAYQVVYSYMTENNQEFYTFQGLGPDKDILWIRESRRLDCAQVPRIAPIGSLDGMFFYVEDGVVLALDAATGETLWENPEFGGNLPNDQTALIDPDGYLYLSGFEGPNLFVLDTQGQTVLRTETFDPDYGYASRLWTEGEQLFVHVDSIQPDAPGKDFSVEMDWIPQAQG